MSTITFGDLEFELRGSDQRRSLQVTVDRDGELILFAPPDCDDPRSREFVRDKRSWIYRKLAEKGAAQATGRDEGVRHRRRLPISRAQLPPPPLDEQTVPVKLNEREIHDGTVGRSDDGRRHMVRW